ncbi:unnamed protein product [Larinioides sclopetarius]|uniref:C2H2-type domain-containing protein n=1 Tax=Larinioides sclopetarius TaxID=280406 RepID=A0AAV2BZJ5_9ARAC
MTMGRYLCQLCYTIVHYGEIHPCFFYKNDDVVYTIPQFREMDTRHCETKDENTGNSNDDHGNICVTTEQTRSTSQALTTPAHSALSIENTDNMLSRDFTDRPSSPEAPFKAPNRTGEMDAHARQPLELKKGEGAVAGPSAVQPHLLGPGGERRYNCDVCHKQFKNKSLLVNHYRKHTGEKPFVCGTCGKEFNKKGNLTQHLRTHTGEKPFACGTCGREFSRKEHLERHFRTHTGEKPFACETCGREFRQETDLERHLRIHTGEKPFVCDTCGKEFSRKGSLTQHKLNALLKKCVTSVAESSNDDHGNVCETAEQTRNISPALTSPAHSVFSIENKDNILSRDFTDRPRSPATPINAPNRKGEMDANENQPLEWKKDAGAEAGASAVHTHSLRPGGKKPYVCNVCYKLFKKKSHLMNHYEVI